MFETLKKVSYFLIAFLLGVVIAVAAPRCARAAEGLRVNACTLVPVQEVKKIAPWPPFFDERSFDEEAVSNGSVCVFPKATVQILWQTSWKQWVDAMGQGAKLEPVAGLGDQAFVYDDAPSAVLAVKVSGYVLTIQYDINDDQGETAHSVRPQLIALGKAFATKLKR